MRLPWCFLMRRLCVFYPSAYDRTGVELWIERSRERYRKDGVGLWAMELATTHELIGDCGVIPPG